jgi:hypothetical protein
MINQNELDRIIVAYSTSNDTKLRHLDESELIKAK